MAEASPSEHKQVIERYLEAFNEQDGEALSETVTEDITVHGLIGVDGNVTDIDEYAEWGMAFMGGVPDAHLELEDCFEAGDKVAARWTATGTHENDLFDMPATNESFEITGLAIFRMEDGKIAEKWYQQDDLDMLQQTGLVE